MTRVILPDGVDPMRTAASNVLLLESAARSDWVLVDAGMPGFAAAVADKAAKRFGGRAPAAIVLTHGHFDHVGSLAGLLRRWDVPVYAHERELPFLTGRADYPAADEIGGSSLVLRVTPRRPHRGIDLGGRVKPLPADGSVPGLPDWQWLATPGHSPGHVSLFRPADRTLAAGDALLTVKPEAAFTVLPAEDGLNGPPLPFTDDWDEAAESILRLVGLKPRLVLPGHGLPLGGRLLRESLRRLEADGWRRPQPIP